MVRRFRRKFRMRQKSKNAQSIVDRSQYDAVLLQCPVFIKRTGCRTARICSAMYPQHYRQWSFDWPLRSQDVEIKTIFTTCLGITAIPVAVNALCAGCTEFF